MKKYIIALIVLLLAVAAYLKFWRKPPDQDGAQDGESGQTGGTGTASSDTSSNTTNTNTNAGGSVAADTKNQLTKEQVMTIQRETNKRIEILQKIAANPTAAKQMANKLAVPQSLQSLILSKAQSVKNVSLIKVDGSFGSQTANAFKTVFDKVITKNSYWPDVVLSWQNQTAQVASEMAKNDTYNVRRS